jgi:hypothetical protein
MSLSGGAACPPNEPPSTESFPVRSHTIRRFALNCAQVGEGLAIKFCAALPIQGFSHVVGSRHFIGYFCCGQRKLRSHRHQRRRR